MKSLKSLLLAILRGIGQIMLQENAVTGLFFLLGIFYGGVEMGLGALFACLVATLAARLLRFNQQTLDSGLYGFSAALVGVAMTLFFKVSVLLFVIIAIGAIAAMLMQHFFLQRKIPVFTLPFVLVTWLLVYFYKQVYPLEVSTVVDVKPIVLDSSFLARGFGQVIFQSSALSGILFCLGVGIQSRLAAIFALLGAFLSGFLSLLWAVPHTEVALGLFSYNAVLCAIVFAGKHWVDALFALLSVLFSVAIVLLMYHLGLSQLTFPFVAATWLTLLAKNYILKPTKKA